MQILVSDHGVFLEEADRFDRFAIVSDLDDEDIASRLQDAVGHRDDAGHFWIKPGWIIAEANASSQSDWQAGFEKMIGFADSRGWIDPATGAIRAHVARQGSE